MRGAVPVDADDDGLGQEGAQGFFDALRTMADGGQVLVAAVGAFERDGFAVVAVVAAQLAGALVQHHFGGTVRAAEGMAAVAAKQRGRETAPVEVHQRHAACFKVLLQKLQGLRREAVVEFQTTYVEDVHLRQLRGGMGALGRCSRRYAPLCALCQLSSWAWRCPRRRDSRSASPATPPNRGHGSAIRCPV